MRSQKWKKFALMVLSGSMMLQIPACTQTAIGITSLASVFTAGGVFYLVYRITE